MTATRQYLSADQASPALIDAFKNTATAIISDNLNRLPGAVGIRPFYKGDTMAGTAVTVRTAPGDNLTIHQALEFVRPGDVLVVDGGGYIDRALIGEIMAEIARVRGACGMVIDGAVRDSKVLIASPFPVFARAAIHLGPYKNGPGEINVPISVGGMLVSPGDIVVGDDDGVVAFPQAIATELLEAVRKQAAKENDVLESIRAGTYTGAYAKS